MNINFYLAFDMRDFANSGTYWNEQIAGGILAQSAADEYRVYSQDGNRNFFFGNNLGQVDNNMPVDGTIIAWNNYQSNGAGVFSMFSFSVSAYLFASYVLSDNIADLLEGLIMTGDDSVYGSGFNDYLLGYDGNDVLRGQAGDDILDGGAGDDQMLGGSGDDTFIVGSDGDIALELTETGGFDTILIRYTPESVTYTVAELVESARNQSGAPLIIFGNTLDNSLYGGSTADYLYGDDGNDYLNGGAGADAVHGGHGNDVFFVDNVGDQVDDLTRTGSAGSGIDEVRSTISYSLLAQPNLADIENLQLAGTASVDAIGNRLNNELTGNSGDNLLNGSAGADIMRGGAGDDIYYIDNGGDRVIETGAGDGIDTVRSSLSHELGDHVENLQLTGGGYINGVGNSLANRISGNGQSNILAGGSGDDILTGNGGTDLLYGNDGADLLDGGTGDDFLDGGAGRDQFTGGAGADSFVFNSGDAGATAGTSDRIVDFSRSEGDQIRLNAIDANATNGAASNDAFAFIGTGAFTGAAGQLRYQVVSGNTYISGDVDGDGTADFVIRVDGAHAFVVGDFVL
ncbi:calcium-binding protein [Sphingomonas sabuli]|uniref:Calcium-binding protein n=1 Tax=Sphingomonas sabuli TaxID=2764186 RepID=A0A7G9KZQ4_9SPHN|nr:calcium-binding protein [Sphingomonas sabuli]QNM81853.1 calcium-binding protein [Sphingomonas sabuli]